MVHATFCEMPLEYDKSLTSTHVMRSQLWQHSANQHSHPEQQKKLTEGSFRI